MATEIPIQVRLREGSKDSAATAQLHRNNAVSAGSELAESMGPAHKVVNRAVGYAADAVGAKDHARAVRSGIKSNKIKQKRKK